MESIEFLGSVFSARVFYEIEQDIARNKTNIRITRVEVKTMRAYYGTFWVYGSISVEDQTAANLILSSAVACAVYLPGIGVYAGHDTEEWGAACIVTEIPVYHAADGTGKMSVSVYLSLARTNDTFIGRLSGTQEIELPRIPRASNLLVESAELGEEMHISVIPAYDGVRDVLSWRCGTASGTIGEADTEYSWIPPMNLAEQVPESETAEILLTVTSFDGETEIGSNTISAWCRVPDTVVPVVSAQISDVTGYLERFGGFVQGQSRMQVSVSAAGQYGAAITGIRISCGALTSDDPVSVFDLPDGGYTQIFAIVIDSRGRQTRWQDTASVLYYSKPQANLLLAERDTDTSAVVRYSAKYTAIGGNALRFFLQKRLRGTEEWQDTEITSSGEYGFQADSDKAFECRIAVRDSFESGYSMIALIPVAFALLDICKTDHAIGIGQRADKANTLSVGLDMDLHGHGLHDLADPVDSGDAVTLGYLLELLRRKGIY